MKYFKISNDGEIDVIALTLLGASSKEGDNSKIGFFGSGNKYALATFLRNGVGVRIFSGATEFSITLDDVEFRGQNFQRIAINGVPTSLTTRTGPEWKLWMALREFLCNAIDEGNYDWGIVDEASGAEAGTTAIYLELNDDLADVCSRLEDIIILDIEPLVVIPTTYGAVSIYDRQNGRAYRKGVCCHSEFKNSLFAYSFERIQINESRVVSSSYTMLEQIATALAKCTDVSIVNKFVSAMLEGERGAAGLLERDVLRGEYWEGHYCTEAFSSTWFNEFISRRSVLCPDVYVPILPPEDVASYLIVPFGFYKKLIEEYPEIPHISNGNSEWIEGEPNDELREIVDKALREVIDLGLGGGVDWRVKYVKFVVEECVMGFSKEHPGVILMSATWHDGVNYPAGILEEITHATTGHCDGSRSLQTHLFAKWLEAERRATRFSRFKEIVTNAVALVANEK